MVGPGLLGGMIRKRNDQEKVERRRDRHHARLENENPRPAEGTAVAAPAVLSSGAIVTRADFTATADRAYDQYIRVSFRR
jgi:hypothetical protein